MKNGKSIVELATEIERQASAAQDYVAPAGAMTMTDDARLLIGDGGATFDGEATAIAHDQIADRLEIPRRYYQRMRDEQPALLATNVNRWLAEAPETRHMVRTLDGKARAVLSDRYHRIDNLQIMAAALPALRELPVQIVSADVTDTRLYLQARFPRVEGEVRKGDAVQAGFILSNSEIGFGALEVRPLVYRLVCTNGMVVAQDAEYGRLRRTHVGRKVHGTEDHTIYADDTREADDRALMLKIRDSIQHLSNPELFMQLVQQMRAATEGEQVVRPVVAVQQLAKAFSLGEREQEGVLGALLRDGDLTRWGMLNAVTNIANGVESYDRAVELEQVGGRILRMPQREWDAIALAA